MLGDDESWHFFEPLPPGAGPSLLSCSPLFEAGPLGVELPPRGPGRGGNKDEREVLGSPGSAGRQIPTQQLKGRTGARFCRKREHPLARVSMAAGARRKQAQSALSPVTLREQGPAAASLCHRTSGLCVTDRARLGRRAGRPLSLEGVTFTQLKASLLSVLPPALGLLPWGSYASLCFCSLGLVTPVGLACPGGRAQQNLSLGADWV